MSNQIYCALDTNFSVYCEHYFTYREDTKFGVQIVINLGHQIWHPGETNFYSVYQLNVNHSFKTDWGM